MDGGVDDVLTAELIERAAARPLEGHTPPRARSWPPRRRRRPWRWGRNTPILATSSSLPQSTRSTLPWRCTGPASASGSNPRWLADGAVQQMGVPSGAVMCQWPLLSRVMVNPCSLRWLWRAQSGAPLPGLVGPRVLQEVRWILRCGAFPGFAHRDDQFSAGFQVFQLVFRWEAVNLTADTSQFGIIQIRIVIEVAMQAHGL